MWTRQQFDDSLPTVARWTGLVLTVILTFALVLGHTEVTPGFVPAAGMFFYKTVKGAADEKVAP